MEPETPAAGPRPADAMLQAPAMQAGRSRGIYALGAEHDAVHGSFQSTNAAAFGSQASPEVQQPWTSGESRDQYANHDAYGTRAMSAGQARGHATPEQAGMLGGQQPSRNSRLSEERISLLSRLAQIEQEEAQDSAARPQPSPHAEAEVKAEADQVAARRY